MKSQAQQKVDEANKHLKRLASIGRKPTAKERRRKRYWEGEVDKWSKYCSKCSKSNLLDHGATESLDS
jgi:hypothetical protein